MSVCVSEFVSERERVRERERERERESERERDRQTETERERITWRVNSVTCASALTRLTSLWCALSAAVSANDFAFVRSSCTPAIWP